MPLRKWQKWGSGAAEWRIDAIAAFYELKIKNYELRITNYELQITN